MARLQEQFIFDHRYKLIKKLGEGGFAEVWLAEDTSTRVILVLKVYMPASKLDEYGIESFRKEYALVFGLNHPNLMQYTYFGICVGNPYLVMPYYDSGSAEDMIGNCSERNAWAFLKDVASGLACLHEQHPAIIHQDIKPANVLLDGRRYVITDFGISDNVAKHVLANDQGDSPTVVGTVPYMAPERFSGSGQALIASDIWSLGASLYEMLSGKLPFGNEGGKAQQKGGKWDPLPDKYSDELRSVVYQCMSLRPSDRPFAEDLANYASQQFDQVRTSSINISQNHGRKSSRSFDKKKKSSKLVLILVVALAVIAAGVFWYLNHQKKVEKEKQEAYEAALTEWEQGKVFYQEGMEIGENRIENFEKAYDRFDEACKSERFMESYAGKVDTMKQDIFDCCMSFQKENYTNAFYENGERKLVLRYLELAQKIKPENQEVKLLIDSIK